MTVSAAQTSELREDIRAAESLVTDMRATLTGSHLAVASLPLRRIGSVPKNTIAPYAEAGLAVPVHSWISRDRSMGLIEEARRMGLPVIGSYLLGWHDDRDDNGHPIYNSVLRKWPGARHTGSRNQTTHFAYCTAYRGERYQGMMARLLDWCQTWASAGGVDAFMDTAEMWMIPDPCPGAIEMIEACTQCGSQYAYARAHREMAQTVLDTVTRTNGPIPVWLWHSFAGAQYLGPHPTYNHTPVPMGYCWPQGYSSQDFFSTYMMHHEEDLVAQVGSWDVRYGIAGKRPMVSALANPFGSQQGSYMDVGLWREFIAEFRAHGCRQIVIYPAPYRASDSRWFKYAKVARDVLAD